MTDGSLVSKKNCSPTMYYDVFPTMSITFYGAETGSIRVVACNILLAVALVVFVVV